MGRLVVLVTLLAAVATGCFKADVAINVNEDGSGEIRTIEAVDQKALRQLGGEGPTGADLIPPPENVPPGVRAVPYSADGYEGVELRSSFSQIEQLPSRLADVDLALDIAAQSLTGGSTEGVLSGLQVHATEDGWSFRGSGFLGEPLVPPDWEDLSHDIHIRVAVTLPGQALGSAHNADRVESGHTFVWDLTPGDQRTRIFATTVRGTAQSSQANPALGWLVVGLLVLAGGAATGLGLSQRRRRPHQNAPEGPAPGSDPAGPPFRFRPGAGRGQASASAAGGQPWGPLRPPPTSAPAGSPSRAPTGPSGWPTRPPVGPPTPPEGLTDRGTTASPPWPPRPPTAPGQLGLPPAGHMPPPGPATPPTSPAPASPSAASPASPSAASPAAPSAVARPEPPSPAPLPDPPGADDAAHGLPSQLPPRPSTPPPPPTPPAPTPPTGLAGQHWVAGRSGAPGPSTWASWGKAPLDVRPLATPLIGPPGNQPLAGRHLRPRPWFEDETGPAETTESGPDTGSNAPLSEPGEDAPVGGGAEPPPGLHLRPRRPVDLPEERT